MGALHDGNFRMLEPAVAGRLQTGTDSRKET